MMRQTLNAPRVRSLVALIALQCLCAVFFIVDSVMDLMGGAEDFWHTIPEVAVTVGLVIGIGFEVQVLRQLLRAQAQMQKGLDTARGALAQVIAGYFQDWGLTQAESDVALFTIKGFSIAEIAGFRGSAEGTVKTHLNAIYRKASVPGRAQLVSLLVEDLMGGLVASPPVHRQYIADGLAVGDRAVLPLASGEKSPILPS